MEPSRAPEVSLLQTDHGEVIHDAQLDFYGTLLATCSSDTKIKVFNVKDNANVLLAELSVHEGPVWQIGWSHPKHGVFLASCSVDGKVVIHRQQSPASYERVYSFAEAHSPINCIAWAPPELGLTVACGASNGSFYLLSFQNNQWEPHFFKTPSTSIHSLSWAPFRHMGSMDGQRTVFRIALAGGDSLLHILKYSSGLLEVEESLSGHKELVQSVSWSPTSGLPGNTLASCSPSEARIWSQTEAHGVWSARELPIQETPLWHVSWSLSGHYLAITHGEQKVSLWRQSLAGEWIEEKRPL